MGRPLRGDIWGVALLVYDPQLLGSAEFAFVDANDVVPASAGVPADLQPACGTGGAAARWSQTYDGVAGQLLDQAADLATAFGLAARLVELTTRNYDDAEAAAAGRPLSRPDPPDVREVSFAGRVDTARDAVEQPQWWWLVESLDASLVWPSGDPRATTEASVGWSRHNSCYQEALSLAGTAQRSLAQSRTPESASAARVAGFLRQACGPLAGFAHRTAAACGTYADAVRAAQEQLQRVARVGGDPESILDAVRHILIGFERDVEDARSQLPDPTQLDGKVTAALRALRGLELAADVTALGNHLGLGRLVSTDDLDYWEGNPDGHTLAEHVGKTDHYLWDRIRRKGKNATSTFTDEPTASWAISTLMADQWGYIQQQLAAGDQKITIQGDVGKTVGRVAIKSKKRVEDTQTVRVVLMKDPTAPHGVRVKTAYLPPNT